MGAKPYQILRTKFKNLNITPDNLVLEIGSEYGEGSTRFFYCWSYLQDIPFITVDVTDFARNKLQNVGIDCRVVDSGSKWCQEELPKLNRKIKVLYLDNFDWNWFEDKPESPEWITEQIEKYAKRGVVMNNANSQLEHKLQLEACLPYMDQESVVIMDDTFMRNGNWSGKGGQCIEVLQQAGYIIEHEGFGAWAYRI